MLNIVVIQGKLHAQGPCALVQNIFAVAPGIDERPPRKKKTTTVELSWAGFSACGTAKLGVGCPPAWKAHPAPAAEHPWALRAGQMQKSIGQAGRARDRDSQATAGPCGYETSPLKVISKMAVALPEGAASSCRWVPLVRRSLCCDGAGQPKSQPLPRPCFTFYPAG